MKLELLRTIREVKMKSVEDMWIGKRIRRMIIIIFLNFSGFFTFYHVLDHKGHLLDSAIWILCYLEKSVNIVLWYFLRLQWEYPAFSFWLSWIKQLCYSVNKVWVKESVRQEWRNNEIKDKISCYCLPTPVLWNILYVFAFCANVLLYANWMLYT